MVNNNQTVVTSVPFKQWSIVLGIFLLPLAASATSSVALPPGLLENTQRTQLTSAEEEEDVVSYRDSVEFLDPSTTSPMGKRQLTRMLPNWTIRFSRRQLINRGYTELTDLLDDLPGIDLIRPYGQPYFKAYWRGNRTTARPTFLILIDGRVFNNLRTGSADVISAIPISSVEAVEVGYGPTIMANGVSGYLNIITDRGTGDRKLGLTFRSNLIAKGGETSLDYLQRMTKVGDVSASFVERNFELSLAARLDDGIVEPALANQFEWLNNDYYSNNKLWGEFAQINAIGGNFHSRNHKEAVDLRLKFHSTELALQYFQLSMGPGLAYPADRQQTKVAVSKPELSLHLSNKHTFSKAFNSQTLLRFRQSGIGAGSALLSRNATTQNVNFSYVAASDIQGTIDQLFSVDIGRNLLTGDDNLELQLGLHINQRSMSKELLNSGMQNEHDPAYALDGSTGGVPYAWPNPVEISPQPANRINTSNIGISLKSIYNIKNSHYVHLASRVAYDSLYKVGTNVQLGYAGELINSFTLRLLYGQSLLEPTVAQQFGAVGGDRKNLEPENSQTFELGMNYQHEFFTVQVNVHYTDIQKIILLSATGMDNAASRRILGVDVFANAIIPIPGVDKLSAWVAGSVLPYGEALQFETPASRSLVPKDIGDFGLVKVWAGATADYNSNLSLTLLGRFISQRTPIYTNPIKTVDSYFTVDANFMVRNLAITGLGMMLKVRNLLNTNYFHPGVMQADSGQAPGHWNGNYWEGSRGAYNSLLPQPGRSYELRISLDF